MAPPSGRDLGLLGLPAELRLMIFEFLLLLLLLLDGYFSFSRYIGITYKGKHRRLVLGNKRYNEWRDNNWYSREHMGILRTCRQIYIEIIPLLNEETLWQMVTFKRSAYVTSPGLNYYYSLSPDNLDIRFSMIRKLNMDISADNRATAGALTKKLNTLFKAVAWGAKLDELYLSLAAPPPGFSLDMFKWTTSTISQQ